MNGEQNPYKTPESAIRPVGSNSNSAWFQNGILIVPIGGTVPTDRCARCSQPAERIMAKRFAWHSPALYLIILLNLLIYLVVALLVQKKGKLSFALCERCLCPARLRTTDASSGSSPSARIASRMIAAKVFPL